MGPVRTATFSASLVCLLGCAGVASAHPIAMPTIAKRLHQEPAIHAANQTLTPPAPPCPESGYLPSPFSNCGLPETPATSLPYMGNMSYWGGPVQVHPKEYVVYWGWGEPGAFPGKTCAPENISEGSVSATLACDPDGAGKYMADFVSQMGGTGWAGVSTQYYQSGSSGKQFISNDTNVLAGFGPMTPTTSPGSPRRAPPRPPGPATPTTTWRPRPSGRSPTSASPTSPTPTSSSLSRRPTATPTR